MPKSQLWVSIHDSCIRIKEFNVLTMVNAHRATSMSKAVASLSPIHHVAMAELTCCSYCTCSVTLSTVRLVRLEFGHMVDSRTNGRSALDIFNELGLSGSSFQCAVLH